MKHNPGPWTVNEYLADECEICSGKTGEVHVAFCNNDTRGRVNARLIAAAPEMLEALRTVELWSIERHAADPWDLVTASIAKAEGSP